LKFGADVLTSVEATLGNGERYGLAAAAVP
jgi:hypothetical protein